MSGIVVSAEDSERLQEHAKNLKQRYQQKVCKNCGESIVFQKVQEDGQEKVIPYDLDGKPHWKSCPYSYYIQKKTSFHILKKLITYHSLRHSEVDIESDLGLTEKEGKVYHAILDRVLKEVAPALAAITDNPRVEDEITFKPQPTDPVGDPDEERAPNEELVKAVHDPIRLDLDKTPAEE